MVGEGERHEKEEWPVSCSIAGDVLDGAIRHHTVHQPARGLVVELHVPGPFTLLRFTDVIHILERHAGVGGPVDDVGRLESKPLVEALIRRQASLSRPEVPFPEHRRAVTGLAQHLGERDLPWMQAARGAGRDRLADA